VRRMIVRYLVIPEGVLADHLKSWRNILLLMGQLGDELADMNVWNYELFQLVGSLQLLR